jgi:hypothetical protein
MQDVAGNLAAFDGHHRTCLCALSQTSPEVVRHHVPHRTPPLPRVYALYGTELQTRPAHVLHMSANPYQALLSHAQCSRSRLGQGHVRGDAAWPTSQRPTVEAVSLQWGPRRGHRAHRPGRKRAVDMSQRHRPGQWCPRVHCSGHRDAHTRAASARQSDANPQGSSTSHDSSRECWSM